MMDERASDNLEGKIVVVTGANGRLGRRMARGFEAHGATVAAVVREAPETVPGGAAVFVADVTDEASVDACFGEIARRFGRLDALVHTVGMWEARPLLETSAADWERVVRVNLTSAFLCFRAAARAMRGRAGRLIGIASGQGADRGRAGQAAYSAAKAGIVRLVEAVAEEFAGSGLTAHAVAPSFIRYAEDDPPGVDAEDLVALCRYLCTDAGAALNGAVLRAYG